MELSAVRYDGRVFVAVGFEGAGEPPTGRYSQDGDLVSAEFAGAHVRVGRLVGRCAADGTVLAGRCVSTPSMLPDGRLRLTEHWQRLDGTTGISQIEEVAA
jgi:hypothetical protein